MVSPGLWWSLLVLSGLFWSLLFLAGLYWSLLVLSGLSWSLLFLAGLSKNSFTPLSARWEIAFHTPFIPGLNICSGPQ